MLFKFDDHPPPPFLYLRCQQRFASPTTPVPNHTANRGTTHTTEHNTAQMHVTACLAGQKEEVEVGEDCRTLQALKESVVKALPQLCVEGFDVSVGGRALDDDEGVVSLEYDVCLDVVPNARGLSVLALCEAGREVSEEGLLEAAAKGNVSLCTLYLDAGVPIDCVDADVRTPLHLSCDNGDLSLATLLLDRGSHAIDEKTWLGNTPLHVACRNEDVSVATLLLDRGSRAIDEKNVVGITPLHITCGHGHLSVATLLLDRGSRAIDAKSDDGRTPLHRSCWRGHLSVATLLLDRGSRAIDEKNDDGNTPLHLACHPSLREAHLSVATLLLDRGSRAIDEKGSHGATLLHLACCNGRLEFARLFLDRGCYFDVEEYKAWRPGYPQEVLDLLSEMVSRPSRPRTT